MCRFVKVWKRLHCWALARGKSAKLASPRPFALVIGGCKIAPIVGFRSFFTTAISRRSITAALLISLTTVWFSSLLNAQSEPTGDDARVQKLYGEAKAAEARGDLAAAAANYESLLLIAPRLAPAYNNLGSLYLRQREYRKAAAVLEKGLKIDPKMSSASALLGIALYEMGDYAAAQRNLESALRANPKDNNAELVLANDLIKLEEFQRAADHLRQLSQRQPENQEVWYLLGKVHMKLSEEALSKLNALDANSVWVHEISGEVMESMKNYDGALLEYKKAVEVAPRQAGTHYHLGNAYWSLNMWDAATEQFRAELANDPSNCRAQWKIGNIILEQHGDSTEALTEVQKALDVCPNLMGARVDRGRALIKLERHAEAVKDLEAAVKADPGESSTHFLLAQAYRALGRTQQAQAEMRVFSTLEESARAKTAERAKALLQEKSKEP
jgi:tetratricopeptide (TPR) repeat protein